MSATRRGHLTAIQDTALRWVEAGCPSYPFPHGNTLNSLIRKRVIVEGNESGKPPWLPAPSAPQERG